MEKEKKSREREEQAGEINHEEHRTTRGGRHKEFPKGAKQTARSMGAAAQALLLEELLSEAHVVVGVLHGLAALRVVGRHSLSTVVCLLLRQVLQTQTTLR